MIIAEPLQLAIEEFGKFPGIGRKTAQRLALFLINRDQGDFERLIDALRGLKEKLRLCANCFNISEHEICDICNSGKRDATTICVVEEASDIIAIERSNEFQGLYHVLGGVLSPLSGITQDDLRIKELVIRVGKGDVKEVLLALNPDTEGETTSLYLLKLLKPFEIKISRIARGLPIGGELEFSDEATIGRAVKSRVTLE